MSNDQEFTLRVLTLNCWGVWLGARRRRQRMEGIVRYIEENNCDIVFLQEIWVRSDFDIIREGTKDIYKFAHLFKAGSVLGSSGIVILSKWYPKVIHFEPYSLNGSPFYPWHGDWFAGKGIAYSRVDFNGISIHLFSTHTHAYYKDNEPIHDQYSVHRVCQSYQLAKFINFISDTCIRSEGNHVDLSIVAGDMNSTSSELPYRLLTNMARLTDCLKAKLCDNDTDDEDSTYCHPRNSFTPCNIKTNNNKRIDFILCRLLTHGQCLIDRIATESKDKTINCSLSDHEPVMVEMKIRVPEKAPINSTYHESKTQVMQETRDILKQYSNYNRKSKIQLFYIISFFFIITLPTSTYYASVNELLPISTILFIWFISSLAFSSCVLIGFLNYRLEQGAIKAILNDMKTLNKSLDNNNHHHEINA